MRQIQFPVTVDIHGNLIDNTGQVVAKPVEGYDNALRDLVYEVATISHLEDMDDYIVNEVKL